MTVPGIRRPGCTGKTIRAIGTASCAQLRPTSPSGWSGNRRADPGSVKLSRAPVTVRCYPADVGRHGHCSEGSLGLMSMVQIEQALSMIHGGRPAQASVLLNAV